MNSQQYNQYQSISILKLVTISCVISLFVFIGNEEEKLQASAETGKGNDVFRVAISIIGVDQSKTGDICKHRVRSTIILKLQHLTPKISTISQPVMYHMLQAKEDCSNIP